MRKLIVHYHLFKNAGTSIDALLKRSFGDNWLTVEFPENLRRNVKDLEAFIRANPHAQAISSHTAQLPLPRIPDVEILPILFVRHPLLRLKSAYSFERKQTHEGVGPNLARVLSFVGYTRALIAIRNRQAFNFQTERFAAAFPRDSGDELTRALRTADTLPFVGVVEDFAHSVARLEQFLAPHFPMFKGEPVRLNVTNPTTAEIDAQLAALKIEMGPRDYERLLDKNANDIILYNKVASARSTGTAPTFAPITRPNNR
ncbi:hypothetical protein ACG3SL_03220 [Sphingomonas sp. CJ20]